ncbi:MAG TPA: hypothetical protein VHZ25_17720, partial [Acidobacteriaceae bacterium]|nr:hypothetical protein [Acidobacteriaceae bacterium]
MSISAFDVDIKQSGTTDYTVNYQQAVSACATKGNRIFFPAAPSGYILTDTLDLGSNMEVYGVKGKISGLGDPCTGTQFIWGGAPNKPMLRAFGTRSLILRGLHLHGNQTAGCVGLLIDSTNTPVSSGNSFRDLVIEYCGAPAWPGGFAADGIAIQIGSTLSGF